MRMTKQRKMILAIFNHNHQPKSAEMIYDKLPAHELNLSTVYRTLDLFFSHGVISKSVIGNKAYYYLNKDEHSHYMICIQCKKMIEIDCHLHDLDQALSEQHHFKVTHHDLTIYGLCENCQNNVH
jgi:Fur family transcriptional regulator, ferric uptake regulator